MITKNSELKLTFQNQHDEAVVKISKYLFEIPRCFVSIKSLHQGL